MDIVDTAKSAASASETKIEKASPFVLLNDTVLDRLVAIARDEPSIADMVVGYRQSLETITMFSEILADECAHYQIPLMQPVV